MIVRLWALSAEDIGAIEVFFNDWMNFQTYYQSLI